MSDDELVADLVRWQAEHTWGPWWLVAGAVCLVVGGWLAVGWRTRRAASARRRVAVVMALPLAAACVGAAGYLHARGEAAAAEVASWVAAEQDLVLTGAPRRCAVDVPSPDSTGCVRTRATTAAGDDLAVTFTWSGPTPFALVLDVDRAPVDG